MKENMTKPQQKPVNCHASYFQDAKTAETSEKHCILMFEFKSSNRSADLYFKFTSAPHSSLQDTCNPR